MGDDRQPGETGAQKPVEGRDPTTGRFAPGNKNGGRPATSRRIREVAQQYGDEAIAGLLELARDGEQPGQVRRAAWVDLLDRGFGKPTVGEPDEDGREVTAVVYRLAGDDGGTGR